METHIDDVGLWTVLRLDAEIIALSGRSTPGPGLPKSMPVWGGSSAQPQANPRFDRIGNDDHDLSWERVTVAAAIRAPPGVLNRSGTENR